MGLREPSVDDGAGHRGDVHDRAAVGQHDAGLGLRRQEYPREVHIDHAAPVGGREIFGGSRVRDARIVEGDVQAAKFSGGQRDGVGHRPGVCDIASDADGLAADLPDRRGGPVGVVLVQIEARNVGTRFAPAGGDGQADTRAAPVTNATLFSSENMFVMSDPLLAF